MLKAKMLLRRLYGGQYCGGWDDELPQAMQLDWEILITEFLHMEDIRIPRALFSADSLSLWLVCFWDGSLDAHASCTYLRREVVDAWGQQVVKCGLLYAKSRVAPLAGTTIAKMEMQGLVQASRDLLKLTRALEQDIDRVVLIGDSMCTHMSLRKDGVAFKPYYQNRVAEIRDNLAELGELVGEVEPTQKI